MFTKRNIIIGISSIIILFILSFTVLKFDLLNFNNKEEVDGVSQGTATTKKLENFKYAYLSNIQESELDKGDLDLKIKILNDFNGRKSDEKISYLKEEIKKIKHENLKYFLNDYLDRKIEVEIFIRNASKKD